MEAKFRWTPHVGVLNHRRRINTEGIEKVVAAAWGTYLNAALTICQQGWFEEKFLTEHPFPEGEGVNRLTIHFIKASIPPSSLYSFFCRRRLFFIGDLVSPLLRFYCVFHYSIHFNTWMVTHPSAIQYPWPKLLNFSDLTGPGVSNLVLPLFYSSFSSNHPDANAARNWINSIPPAAGMTFAFSSVFILLQRMSKPLVSSPLSSPRKTSMDESALDAKAGLILCIQRDCPTHPRWSFFIWEKGGDHMRVFIYGWS